MTRLRRAWRRWFVCAKCGWPRGYHSPAILRPPHSVEYHKFVRGRGVAEEAAGPVARVVVPDWAQEIRITIVPDEESMPNEQ